MTTKKTRISTYLPQHLFDIFEQFRAERGLSSSAATGLIMANYFELNLADVNESVLTRLVKLEQQMAAIQSGSSPKSSRSRKLALKNLPDLNKDFVQVELFSEKS